MALIRTLGKWAPEALGMFGLVFFGFWGYSSGMPLVMTVLIAILSGFSLWLATQVAAKMAKEGKKGRVGGIATVAAVALPLLVGFMIKMQDWGHDITVWGSILFWCGITTGLAMGTYGTYHQMK